MEILLLTIGKTRTGYLQEGIEEYLKRLRRYTTFRIQTLPDVKGAGKMPEQSQKEAEGDMMLEHILSSDLVVLLDERGDELTSRGFATRLQQMMVTGRKRILFIVGGPYGFSERVYDRADRKISLSQMTFNHEMVRLFFAEQIYRAFTILNGEPYHHD